MKVLLLLPLSRFHVEYQVGSGRPFSDLDRLVLSAISEKEHPTLEDLQTVFRLPRRLLLEVVVTLMEEGWLAFDSLGRFALTASGNRANNGSEKSRTMLIKEQKVSVWLEGYSGALLAAHLPYASESELKRERHGQDSLWDLAYHLTVRYGRNELDWGTVRQLLREPSKGWIQRITKVEPRGRSYLTIGVDLESRVTTGLPEQWSRRLGPELLEAAARVPTEYLNPGVSTAYFEVGAEKPEPKETGGFHDELPPEAILCNVGEHEEVLESTLRKAHEGDSILIASARLDIGCVSRLASPINAALQAGVHIDLLWGAASENGAAPRFDTVVAVRTALEALTKDSLPHSSGAGRLRWNPAPARSNAQMLLWVNSERDDCRGYVTSYDWLSSADHAQEERQFGFRLTNPGLIAGLCQHGAAMLSSGPDNELGGCADRWRMLAGELEKLYFRRRMEASQPCEFPVQVTVIRDGDHSFAFQDLIATQGPVSILAPLAEPKPWILPCLRKASSQNQLTFYSAQERPMDFTTPCRWETSAASGAIGAISVNKVLATNCNPLCGRVPGSDGRADLGVLLSGPELGQRCAERIGFTPLFNAAE